VPSRRRAIAVAAFAVAAAIFVALRVALIEKRPPDIDEIFTVWLVRKPAAAMMATLVHDTGPPLYYFVLHALGIASLAAARSFSVICAAAACLLAIATARSVQARVAIAFLMAADVHSVFFGAEARTYALCGAGVAAMTLALDRWVEDGQRRWLAISTAALLITSYGHYYGILFFPVPFVVALMLRRDRLRDAFVASVAPLLLFVPGFMLLSRQPPEGVAWMRIADPLQRVVMVAGSFARITPDARHPFSNPFLGSLVAIAAVALLIVSLWRTRSVPAARLFLVILVVPIVGAIALAVAGFTAYFPVRFESLLVAPAALWIATAAGARWSAAAFAIGLVASIDLLLTPLPAPAPQHAIAVAIATHTAPAIPIAASRLVFLELTALRPSVAFPRVYAVAPFAIATDADVALDMPSLPLPCVWGGASESPEARALSLRFRTRVVARVGGYEARAVYNRAP
jgi:hypothetical protein